MMRKLLFMLLISTALVACEQGSDKISNITVTNPSALNQTVYADNTTGKSKVTFVTLDAWTSSIVAQDATKSTSGEKVDWISIDPESGKEAGSYTISIALQTNQTGERRRATITINCGEDQITITVTQEATNEKEEETPGETDGKVKKINGERVVYDYSDSNMTYVSQIGTQSYINKAYAADCWAYVGYSNSRDSNWGCYYTYGNDTRVMGTSHDVWEQDNPEISVSWKTEFSWNDNTLSSMRGDQVRVERDGYLRTDLEYGDQEYTKGNIDINWLVATREYYTGLPVSALVVRTTRANKLLVKKVQQEEQGEGKYNATITYRYVLNADGFITEIYEHSTLNGSETKIYEFEY